MHDAPIATLLEIAVAAALSAGQQLRHGQLKGRSVAKVTDHDVKIAADRWAEGIIVGQLRGQTPYAILTEEAGFIDALDNREHTITWIVDPLDGSLNYSQGIPMCCISIGLYRHWEPLAGLVFDFNRDELFTGIVGSGAFCNGQRIKPSMIECKKNAVLATGFPANRDYSDVALRDFVEEVKIFRKVRLLGSAALSLAYVACGRIDAYMEENIMFWDVAGGCALVRAAGGAVNYRKRNDFRQPVTVSADNGCLKSSVA